MSVTAKGTRWEILHSLWIGWTFTLGFFNWIAFLYIGVRAKRRRWIYWGLFYSVAFLQGMLHAFVHNPSWRSWGSDVNVALILGLGVLSIVHAFRVRKEYLIRLEAVQEQSRRDDESLRQRLIEVHQPENRSQRIGRSSKPAESSTPIAPDDTQGAQGGKAESAVDGRIRRLPQMRSRATKAEPQNLTALPAEQGNLRPGTLSGSEIDYRITSSYPFPLAFGFRSLMSVVDYRDLYREQLRIAENMLAFLASLSLALLREQDRHSAGIDLKGYWRSGISPGDWQDIVGRCSNIFDTYEDVPLAAEISALNMRLEKKKKEKGFGKDVTKLIQAKNDYKHDRGPTVLEEIADASQDVQETLKRCMEKLAFSGNYPIRQVEDFNVSRGGDRFFIKCLRYMGDHPSFPQEEVVFHRGLRKGDLYLDLDGRNWVPLYPFIVPMTCSHCKTRETYFIDLWDPRRGTARMKSFERGHTMSNTAVAEALAQWNIQAETAS